MKTMRGKVASDMVTSFHVSELQIAERFVSRLNDSLSVGAELVRLSQPDLDAWVYVYCDDPKSAELATSYLAGWSAAMRSGHH